MRVDAHHHIWRYDPAAYPWIEPGSRIAADFGDGELEAAMDACGVDGAIAVQARQLPEETKALVDLAGRSPAIIGVVGWIDLRADDVADRLEETNDTAIVGYRHVVQDESDDAFLLQEAFVRGVRAVVSRGLTYDILVNHRQLATVPAFLDRVGDGVFVLDHAAKPAIARGEWQPWASAIAEVARHPNVSCKVSGLVTEADHAAWNAGQIEPYLDHVFTQFGTERLIWGSDWPVCLLAADYGEVHDLIANYVARNCPAAEAAIFGENALRAYAISGAGA